VLIGIVPFRELAVPDPIAIAANRIHPYWAVISLRASPGGQLNLFALMIKIGAVAGLTSVILVLCYAQTRILYAMARDGLLPACFAYVHPRRQTPWIGTLLLGALVAANAALLPLMMLSNLVSLGTALAFAIVCYSVWHLRRTRPDIVRPFRAPGAAWIALVGAAACLMMAVFNLVPMVQSALAHDPVPLAVLVCYCLLGAVTYLAYGLRSSRRSVPSAIETSERGHDAYPA
jgi:APA family basic amino acid/polyamine antiporter